LIPNDYLVGKYAIELNDAAPLPNAGPRGRPEGSVLFRVQLGGLWHLVTVTWSQGKQRVYLNNALWGERFDSLLRVEHALTPEEIAAIVESDAPVFGKTTVSPFSRTVTEDEEEA
jgi:hypothetical protein